MVHWSASITNCTSRCASRKGENRAHTVAIIHSQTAKGSQRGSWLDPSGYDAGKKSTLIGSECLQKPGRKGRKRHILVDTLGLLLNAVIYPADVQDRDGALHLLRRARRL